MNHSRLVHPGRLGRELYTWVLLLPQSTSIRLHPHQHRTMNLNPLDVLMLDYSRPAVVDTERQGIQTLAKDGTKAITHETTLMNVPSGATCR